MSHLGDRISAFVDGELGHDARERTLAHLAGCAECRAEAEAERQVRKAVSGMGQPQPSGDLMSRLMAIGGGSPSDPPPPPAPPAPRTVSGLHQRSLTGTAPLAARPRNTGMEHRRLPDRNRRLTFVTAGAFSLAAFTLTTTFALGGQDEEDRGTRVVTPPVDRYYPGHAAVLNGTILNGPFLGGTSLTDPPFGVVPVSQSHLGPFGQPLGPVPGTAADMPATTAPERDPAVGPADPEDGSDWRYPEVVPLSDSSFGDPHSSGGSPGVLPR